MQRARAAHRALRAAASLRAGGAAGRGAQAAARSALPAAAGTRRDDERHAGASRGFAASAEGKTEYQTFLEKEGMAKEYTPAFETKVPQPIMGMAALGMLAGLTAMDVLIWNEEVIVALCFIAFSYGAIEKGGPMIQAMFDEKIGGIQESLGAQTKAEMNVLKALKEETIALEASKDDLAELLAESQLQVETQLDTSMLEARGRIIKMFDTLAASNSAGGAVEEAADDETGRIIEGAVFDVMSKLTEKTETVPVKGTLGSSTVTM